MKVGFIGLGHMGGPMCRNVIKGGHEVVVLDLVEAAVAACVDVGGSAGDSIADVAGQSDIIMTSLPMPKDVEAVALGPDGIAANAKAGSIFVDLSTNSPTMMRKIAEAMAAKDIATLDAPVSGGVIGAEKATIAIMVGGDEAVFEQCQPVFQSFGKNIVHTGAVGSGCIAKLVNNMMAFVNMAAAAEGMVLGTHAGIDPSALDQIIRTSSGDSLGHRAVAKSAFARDFEPGFTIDLAYKDMGLALHLAEELDMPLFLGPQVHSLMRSLRAQGHGDKNVTAIINFYEEIVGKTVVRNDGA